MINNFLSENHAISGIVEKQNALLHFHCNSGYVNAPQCYVICILPILSCL